MKKRLLFQWIAVCLAVMLFAGCQDIVKNDGNADELQSIQISQNMIETEQPQEPENSSNVVQEVRKLNGVPIEEYCLIYNSEDVDYSYRAAQYIQSEIQARTGVRLELKTDGQGAQEYEIVVGETERAISKKLNALTLHTQFAILADQTKIALEGDYFIIAAAAYFFVETYIPSAYFDSDIPRTTTIREPIQKGPKNFIFLIGDGMGVNQTRLFDVYDAPTTGSYAYHDGEDIFYGYYLPNQGFSRTGSLSGVTDSAAGATALACGYKTKNGYVGMGANKNSVQSLTELAAKLGKATAVMSTDVATGATPASFSAHAADRNDSTTISASQAKTKHQYGTKISCGWDMNTPAEVQRLETQITTTLNDLSKDKEGFFLMYEEGHIDKYSHRNNMPSTFYALLRFNQVIGLCMEYAFYHPDTFVIITADHETGGLQADGSGGYVYTYGDHTGANVPIFAYGKAANVFHDLTIENTQIPKTIASMMGVENFGSKDYYTSLLK